VEIPQHLLIAPRRVLVGELGEVRVRFVEEVMMVDYSAG